MNDIEVARALGWFSIGLGAFEIVSGGRLSRSLGLHDRPTWVRAFGLREAAAGAMILANPDAPVGLWARVAGDALDIGVLGQALGSQGRHRSNAIAATIAVIGVTVADILCALALTARSRNALRTARTHRVTYRGSEPRERGALAAP